MPIQFRLKELMARHERVTGEKMTYRRLSERTGLGVRNISLIANQQQKMVSLATIDRLCVALDCSPGDLLVRVSDDRQRQAEEDDAGSAAEYRHIKEQWANRPEASYGKGE